MCLILKIQFTWLKSKPLHPRQNHRFIRLKVLMLGRPGVARLRRLRSQRAAWVRARVGRRRTRRGGSRVGKKNVSKPKDPRENRSKQLTRQRLLAKRWVANLQLGSSRNFAPWNVCLRDHPWSRQFKRKTMNLLVFLFMLDLNVHLPHTLRPTLFTAPRIAGTSAWDPNMPGMPAKWPPRCSGPPDSSTTCVGCFDLSLERIQSHKTTDRDELFWMCSDCSEFWPWGVLSRHTYLGSMTTWTGDWCNKDSLNCSITILLIDIVSKTKIHHMHLKFYDMFSPCVWHSICWEESCCQGVSLTLLECKQHGFQ